MALIPEEPRKRSAILVVLAALAGIYFFYEHWYQPRAEEVERLEQRLTDLENQNRQARVVAARGGEDLEERLALYERHVGRLEELIPQTEEVPALLNAMALEARDTRVDLASIRPEPARETDHYTMQSYEISVVGDYHNVGRYLASIASLPRVVRPVDLELSPFTGDPAMTGMAEPLVAQFRVQTYVIPSRPGDLTDLLEDLPDGQEPLPEVEDAFPGPGEGGGPANGGDEAAGAAETASGGPEDTRARPLEEDR